jgi:exonuclease III
LNKRAAERLIDADVDRFARAEGRASDHTPVWATLRQH